MVRWGAIHLTQCGARGSLHDVTITLILLLFCAMAACMESSERLQSLVCVGAFSQRCTQAMGACLISKATIAACHFTMITFCLQCTACVGVLKYAACILLFSQYIDATLGACMQAFPYACMIMSGLRQVYARGLCCDYATPL